MAKSKVSTLKLVQLSILIALMAVLTFTPLGFIIIPPISITILHIPVIIGAILLGPVYGGVLGGAFGIMSMIRASTTGNVGDVLFSPFASGEPISSIIMCIVPRILLGILAGLLYLWFKKLDSKGYWSVAVASAIATIVHTVGVLGCMWLFFDSFPLKDVFGYIITVNGLLEIAGAVVIATAVSKPLFKLLGKRQS